jgi:ribonuclease HII
MLTDSPVRSPVAEDAPDLYFEKRAIKRRGATLVAGVDEVGRGPLAGPVVVAAVILNRRKVPDGLNDSKVLTAAAREALHDEIVRTSVVSVVTAPPSIIARINILHASLWAMRKAVMALSTPPDYLLVDGNIVPSGLPCRAEAVVDGDAKSLSIAAASIVAKVTRDRMCQVMHCEEPHFGFDSHKGYSAAAHFRALEEHGPGRYHRMDFAPCIEADTRRRNGIPIGPLVPAGWVWTPKPQLEMAFA